MSLKMKVELDSSFPSEVRRRLQGVAEEVLFVVRKRMPASPPQGERDVICGLHNCDPITLWPSPSPSIYRILLNVQGDFWAQLAYQLGHELGHIMLDPSRTNGVIEILATAVSLQTLSDLGRKWASAISFRDRTAYAKHFGTLRATNSQEQMTKLPEEVYKAVSSKDWVQVSKYLHLQRDTLTKLPEHRPLNHLGAVLLLERGIPWPEIVGLGSRTSPDFSQDPGLRKDLQITPQDIPDWLLPVWERFV
jgi:hypothetical protein